MYALLLLLALWGGLGCRSVPPPPQNTADLAAAAPDLIPYPRQLQLGQGAFQLKASTRIQVQVTSEEVTQTAQFLAQALQESLGLALKVENKSGKAANAIVLRLNSELQTGPEGYTLSVTPTSIICEAKTGKGLFWAVQSLRQMLAVRLNEPNADNIFAVPAMTVTDEPAFAWRGLLLDVSRHFMSKDFLKRYIDLLSFYKLNTLHLHLTDDQGWRLEIPGYPRLTQVGAWRQEPEGTRHGGYYTAADIRELVAYAQERHIAIVPEIDAPGHVQAALAAYPEFSCTGGPFEVSNHAGVHPDILCAGNEKTYDFLEVVFKQVAGLFPAEYVHIGGDEAPKARWEKCPKCQARMKQEGIAHEEELQGYFTRRMLATLRKHGKKPVAWDEVMKGGIGSETTVQAWHGVGAVKEALGKGAAVIVSPRSSFYFDLNSGITNLRKVLETPIIPPDAPAAQQSLVLGSEAALWTETVPQEKVDGMLFPRLMAFAQNVWQSKPTVSFEDFARRLPAHYAYLDKIGVRYGFETWPVILQPRYDQAAGTFQVQLQPGLANVALHYTLDGTVPTLSAPVYTGAPVQFSTSATLKVVPFKNGEPWNEPVEATFVKHLVLYKTPLFTNNYHPAYPGGGPNALTDGILGDQDYRKGFWQGFERKDMEAVIDLGQEQVVQEVSIRFLQDVNSWIFLPSQVEFQVAGNDKKFSVAKPQEHTVPVTLEKPLVKEFSHQAASKKTRYIKIRAKNIGVCPPGHPGAGGGAYLMADEIMVK
ncbi:beta-N-acetylhexosaminidase [Rufibacter immobilis]|uniref:beta-N-acetylhexosaminidase n=1 Tax=Rufibacter immobilis TaxID=1348778 RepID=UPI0035EDA4FE